MKNDMMTWGNSGASPKQEYAGCMAVKVEEISAGGSVEVCQNLCMVQDGVKMHGVAGAMGVCESPVATAVGNRHPLARFHHIPEGVGASTLFVVEGAKSRELAVERDGAWQRVYRTTGEVNCAIARGDGFMVITSEGIIEVSYNEESLSWSARERSMMPPSIRIGVKKAGRISVSTAAMTLHSVGYNNGVFSIPSAGRSTVTKALTEGYDALVRKATASGMIIQPVLVQYFLRGETGELLYESAPVLIVPEGRQCTDEIESNFSYTDSTLAIPGLSLEATGYIMEVRAGEEWESGVWHEIVKRIEVKVSEQWHPVDFEREASIRFIRSTTANARIMLRLPGAEVTESAMASDIKAAIGRDDTTTMTAARLDGPIWAGDTEVMYPLTETASETNKKRNSRTGKMLAESNDEGAGLLNEIMSPNGFIAGRVWVDGDLIVWGDITPILGGGNNITEMAWKVADAPWRAVVRVTMADGRIATGEFEGTTDMPVTMGPLITYRNRYARKMEIYIESDTEGYAPQRRVAIPLSGAGNGMSMYVSSQLSEISFEEWDGDIPEVTRGYGERRPGMLVSSFTGNPLQPICATPASHSQIMAITGGGGSRSVWNNSRARITVYTTDGIYRANLDSAGNIKSVSQTDNRGADRKNAVTPTPDGSVSVHAGTLLLSSGNGVKELLRESEATEIAWNKKDGCLWMIDRRGNPTVYNTNTGGLHSPLTRESVEHLWSVEGELYMSADETLMQAEKPKADTAIPVKWRKHVDLPRRCRPSGIYLHATGSTVKCSVKVERVPYPGAEADGTLLQINLDGRIDTPLMERIVSPICRHVVIDISGEVSADFSFHNIELMYSR